jgi:hypothetical protein
MRYLFRDGRLLTANGKAVTDDCPQECCGTGAQCYSKFDSCLYQQLGTCAEEQKPLTIYVSRLALLALEAMSKCRFVDGNVGILYWGGRCFTGGECEFGNPSDPDFNPALLTPIPPGSIIVTDAVSLSCKVDCTDPECFDSLWVPVVECPGQPNHFERPRYICARTLEGCAMVRLPNDAGRLVCGSANPVTAIGNPDPAGEFLTGGYGPDYNGDCCKCLTLVPEDTCQRVHVGDTTDPCNPWSGPVDCCCDLATDYWCVNDYFFQYEPRAADIISNGHSRLGIGACGNPGDSQVTIMVQERWPSLPVLNSNYPLTFGFGCGQWPSLTDMVSIAFGYFCNTLCNPIGCENEDPDRLMSHLEISRTCNAAFINAVYTQYENGSNRSAIRAIWRFRFNATKVANGNCSGGCSGNGGVNGVLTTPSEGQVQSLGGCAGCGGGNRTEIR